MSLSYMDTHDGLLLTLPHPILNGKGTKKKKKTIRKAKHDKTKSRGSCFPVDGRDAILNNVQKSQRLLENRQH